MIEAFGLSIRRACGVVEIARSTLIYQTKIDQTDEKIKVRMRELAMKKRRWGCPMIHDVLKREGLVVNHKRTERIYYREEKLSLKLRKRSKKRISELRVEMPPPTGPNERWSMDFVHSRLASGRRFKCLTILDEFARESPALEVDTSIPGLRVIRVLDWLKETRGLPKVIRIDNGPEFSGKALDDWAWRNHVKLEFIEPGKPTQNAYIESFNGRFREECLNEHWFYNLQEARMTIENWRLEYNDFRPHSSLKGLTPNEFMCQYQQSLTTQTTQKLYFEVAQSKG
jgi:putative transposase